MKPALPTLWDGALRRLGSHMPALALDTWIRPLTAHVGDERIRLLCPTPFHRTRVRERYLSLIERCVEAEGGRALPVELLVRSTGPEPRREERRAHVAEPAGAPPPVQRELPYRFDTFVVGNCNALAREAAFAVARGQQQGLYPLLLASRTGLGKTHLARAIVEEARSAGTRRAIYVSAEGFTNDFLAAIRVRRTDRFKRRYRDQCDLLVMDDIQFLRKKVATQLEMFHTLTHLLDVGARVVLTGDSLPRDIDGLDPRLQSQMSAGLVVQIEAPDATVRREILRARAASGGVRLPEDCLQLLVDRARGSVRDLEGVLIQLVATASLLKRRIDLELTRAALRKVEPLQPDAPRLRPREVTQVVAAFFRTRPEVLASRSRRRDVLVPRQLAMYLCRRYTDASLTEIGRDFGRDHPAVANAIVKVERRILEHAPLRYQVEALCERLDALERRGAQ